MLALSRRTALAAGALLLPSRALGQAAPWRKLRDLEGSSGTRIGLAAIDTGSGNAIFYREAELFLMCSTCKLLVVAAVLSRIGRGQESATRLVRYGKADMMDYSAVTRENIAQGMTVGALCKAAIQNSDNTAGALLMRDLGGPAAVTRYVQSLGDMRTRLDRTEPMLNEPDGNLDTTAPSAMLADMKTLLLENALAPVARQQLMEWLKAGITGVTRLRAGLPPSWTIGDKTGSGGGGAVNDIAIAIPPGRAAILIAAYTNHGSDAVLAEIGRILAGEFA